MRQIAELKTVLSTDPIKGVKLFDNIVKTGDQDTQISGACESLANYIRHSSLYKRRIVFQQLQECSLLSRLHLGLQFNSYEDSSFPRKFIFEGSSLEGHKLYCEEPLPDQRHYATSVGYNRNFNLALVSDGNPVPEPRVIDLPRLTKIEMSDQHTVFLTKDNQIYGCGKLSAFMPYIEDSGHGATPALIQIPNIDAEDVVREIRVTEGGTQICIGEKWYFIGKVPSNTKNLERISLNCQVSTVDPLFNMENSQYQETNVSFDGTQAKIFLKRQGSFLHWDRSILFTSPKSVHFILNGIEENGSVDTFQVLSDGTIYIGKNGILKGKLELWKNADDGFQVKNGTKNEHFETKYSLVALLEELPGTNGTDFFKVSPNGENLIMKKGHDRQEYPFRQSPYEDDRNTYHWQSIQPHIILRNREKESYSVDIPMDLTVAFKDSVNDSEEVFLTNRLTWNMIHPNRASTGENQIVNIEQEGCEIQIDWTIERSQEDLSSRYFPADTPPELILHLNSSNGEQISCHKYLHFLHSRQIFGHMNFQSNLYGAVEEAKPLEIKAEFDGKTVRNSLNGMVDIRSLYDITTLELIDCICYYSYHMMDEMFSDAFHILVDTTTEFTVSLLFALYSRFTAEVIDGLVGRPELLFHTLNPPEHPSKQLLVDFAKKYELKHGHRNREENANWESDKPNGLSFYDPEYVMKSLVHLDEDSEDVIWSSLRKELANELDTWHSIAMKSEEEKRERTRNRNSSSAVHRHSSILIASSPIPIGGQPRTESFSRSAISPAAEAFSMSPMNKTSPIEKPRLHSICDSFDDFPEMGGSPIPSVSTPKSLGRFLQKGQKMKKDPSILKTPPTQNPWKTDGSPIAGAISEIQEDEQVDFNAVVEKEKELQQKIRTGNKKEVVFSLIQIEEEAVKELFEMYKNLHMNEALIRLELDEHEVSVQADQVVWGDMPGLVRR